MDDAGYQPAWPDDLWPWIRRPTMTSRESGELVDLSWGAPVPGTGWRVYGQRPWHSDGDLEAVAADPDVPEALASLERARARLAKEAEHVGLVDKPTRVGIRTESTWGAATSSMRFMGSPLPSSTCRWWNWSRPTSSGTSVVS